MTSNHFESVFLTLISIVIEGRTPTGRTRRERDRLFAKGDTSLRRKLGLLFKPF